MKKLGLIINPIAGMGGTVGLKGTDNMVEEAIKRGAVPKCRERVEKALEELLDIKALFHIYTYGGEMGGDLVKEMGFTYKLLKKENSNVSREDTISLAKQLIDEKVDMILFAGGDGTARDIYESVGTDMVSLGIPAGVKIHSPVYAKNPRKTGELTKLYLQEKVKKVKEVEVLDIDEERYRRNIVNTKLYGYLTIPFEKDYVQNRKTGTPLSELAVQESIAHEIIENMEEDTYYLIGAGTTTRGIMQMLNLDNTLIGIDLIYNKTLIKNDLSESEILKYIEGKKTKLIITITGGQGYLLGRGNQQLTPQIIKIIGKENIIIVCTKNKLASLKGEPLLVDTSDSELDNHLSGYYKVITSYGEGYVCKVSS